MRLCNSYFHSIRREPRWHHNALDKNQTFYKQGETWFTCKATRIKRRCWDFDKGGKKCHLLIQTGPSAHKHQVSAKLWRYNFSPSSFYIWVHSLKAVECLDDGVVSHGASPKFPTPAKQCRSGRICIPAFLPSMTNCGSCSLCLPSPSMFEDKANTVCSQCQAQTYAGNKSLRILNVCF